MASLVMIVIIAEQTNENIIQETTKFHAWRQNSSDPDIYLQCSRLAAQNSGKPMSKNSRKCMNLVQDTKKETLAVSLVSAIRHNKSWAPSFASTLFKNKIYQNLL